MIVAAYVPGALIADRTAENQPSAGGSVFVVSNRKRAVELPGLTIHPRKGHPPLETDPPFIGGLRLSSPARAYLDNMRGSRSRAGAVSRTLAIREIEERLEALLRASGEAALRRIRDEARAIAPLLDAADEFARLDALIGALLGTRDTAPESPLAIARARGKPYDPHRLDLLQHLHGGLSRMAAPSRPAKQSDGLALPFFEAYFSNFIEGTEFAVDEAARIVFEGQIPRARPEDAHDILGTWKIVSSHSRIAAAFEEFLEILKRRHATPTARVPPYSSRRTWCKGRSASRSNCTEASAPRCTALSFLRSR